MVLYLKTNVYSPGGNSVGPELVHSFPVYVITIPSGTNPGNGPNVGVGGAVGGMDVGVAVGGMCVGVLVGIGVDVGK